MGKVKEIMDATNAPLLAAFQNEKAAAEVEQKKTNDLAHEKAVAVNEKKHKQALKAYQEKVQAHKQQCQAMQADYDHPLLAHQLNCQLHQQILQCQATQHPIPRTAPDGST